jgi:hypothetical protein
LTFKSPISTAGIVFKISHGVFSSSATKLKFHEIAARQVFDRLRHDEFIFVCRYSKSVKHGLERLKIKLKAAVFRKKVDSNNKYKKESNDMKTEKKKKHYPNKVCKCC